MGKILGCGIDIEELARFEKLIPSAGEIPGFSRLVFTQKEIDANRLILPHLTFPLAFSCKEAFFKAFGVSWTNSSISWKDIEIIFHDENNLEDYSIKLHRTALKMIKEKNIVQFLTSLEYTEDYILFQVFLMKE